MRIENVLDRWLDVFEASLDTLVQTAPERLAEAAPKLPEPAKLTDLGAVLTIMQRMLQIQVLRHKLADMESASHEDSGFAIDPRLLEEGILESGQTE